MGTRNAARLLRHIVGLVLILWMGGAAPRLFAQNAAQTLIVSENGPYQTIDAALSDAGTGDVIEVRGGVYAAPLTIDKSVVIVGIDAPVIDGRGEGSLVLINAPDVSFQGFVLRNTGRSLEHEDTAIVAQSPRVTIADNVLEDVLFGIYFANAPEGIAEGNTIQCIPLDPAVRGDGIRVWYSQGVIIRRNEARTCRDMLFWYSDNLLIEQNYFHDNRYALHFMYNKELQVLDNRLEDSTVGTYFMYSDGLTIERNQIMRNRGVSGYGIALKDANQVKITDNLVVDNLVGVYIDNSPTTVQGTNDFTRNVIALNNIGVTAQPSVRSNTFTDNAFIDNEEQAATNGRGTLQGNTWTVNGVGNYWSDYAGYDQDGDGIGDLAYRSEELFERLADEYPALRLFVYSPATQAIEFGGAAFPMFRPDPKLIDEAPLLDWTLPQLDLSDNLQNDNSGAMLGAALAMFALGCLCIYSLRLGFPRPQAQ